MASKLNNRKGNIQWNVNGGDQNISDLNGVYALVLVPNFFIINGVPIRNGIGIRSANGGDQQIYDLNEVYALVILPKFLFINRVPIRIRYQQRA
jgi:hypothetical protein